MGLIYHDRIIFHCSSLDMTFLLFFFILFIIVHRIFGELQCWFPRGELFPGLPLNNNDFYAGNDRPSYPERPASFCCGVGEICASNKMCLGNPGSGYAPYNRGTCTDVTWQSPECSQFCNRSSTLQICKPDVYCCPDNNTTPYCDCEETDHQIFLPSLSTFATINPRTSSVPTTRIKGLSHSVHISDGVWAAIGAVTGLLSLVLSFVAWRWQIQKARAKVRDNGIVSPSTQTQATPPNASIDLEGCVPP